MNNSLNKIIFIFFIAFLMLAGSLYYNHSINDKISLNNDEIIKIQKIHEEEIKAFNISLEEEKRKNNEALKILKDQLDSINTTYQKKLEDLEKSKDKKKVQLLNNSSLDSLANDLLKVVK